MEFSDRKHSRLENYDYSQNGAYFITVCPQNRKKILSKISVGEGLPLPQLLPYGKIAIKWIDDIPKYNEFVMVDKYVIMPDHIHLLLSIKNGRGDLSPTIKNIIGWFKYNCTKEINSITGEIGKPIFQRSYYDHVIRNNDDYNETWEYIDNNPKKYLLKQTQDS